MRETKQIIIVRKDLNMRKGKIGAQVAHASLAAFLKLLSKDDSGRWLRLEGKFHDTDPVNQWLTGGFTKICVGCDTEAELRELIAKAHSAGLITSLITDSGKTEFNGVPTLTCGAIGPGWSDEIDKITKHLKLI